MQAGFTLKAAARTTRYVAMVCMAMGVVACGSVPSNASSGSGGALQAEGLFAPSLPSDRPLAPEERTGDFDAYLQLATREATRWDSKARLTGAQGVNVDRLGRKAGGTQYAYTFSQGRHALTVTIAGNNVAFEKAKVAAPLPGESRLPAQQILQAALDSALVDGEAFYLMLALPTGASKPVFLVAEHKREGRQAMVDAQSGQVLPVKNPTR